MIASHSVADSLDLHWIEGEPNSDFPDEKTLSIDENSIRAMLRNLGDDLRVAELCTGPGSRLTYRTAPHISTGLIVQYWEIICGGKINNGVMSCEATEREGMQTADLSYPIHYSGISEHKALELLALVPTAGVAANERAYLRSFTRTGPFTTRAQYRGCHCDGHITIHESVLDGSLEAQSEIEQGYCY